MTAKIIGEIVSFIEIEAKKWDLSDENLEQKVLDALNRQFPTINFRLYGGGWSRVSGEPIGYRWVTIFITISDARYKITITLPPKPEWEEGKGYFDKYCEVVESPPNIWRAWHKEYNEPHFFVGHFHPHSRLFWRAPVDESEGSKTIVGNFSEMRQYARKGKYNYHAARMAAYNRYGYSKVVDVPGDALLGDNYGRLVKVIT